MKCKNHALLNGRSNMKKISTRRLISELKRRKPKCKDCAVIVSDLKQCACLWCIWKEFYQDNFKPIKGAK